MVAIIKRLDCHMRFSLVEVCSIITFQLLMLNQKYVYDFSDNHTSVLQNIRSRICHIEELVIC
jgi:hypothetical protein